MAAQNKISHQVGEFQNDVFRFDIHGVKSDIVGSHPLETLCQSAKQREEEMKRRILVDTYGTAFPMKMDFDRQILSRFQRPTGAIPSSMLGLEAVTGSLEDFGFEHYLNGTLKNLHMGRLLDRFVPLPILYNMLWVPLETLVNLNLSDQRTCIMEWKCALASPKDRLTQALYDSLSFIQ